ncbi:purine-cytosine permease family protein [Actinomadura fibrosa]|uniref:Purine-cytosine permease family protein n=1 Tax=Actinomadura fibrosa TaxID=111802 RepID=A0ABW2Y2N6_9ACTN|nr:cytosine permease [Actinomadura fibrosa]
MQESLPQESSPASRPSDLRSVIEDHALVPVPEQERRGGWALAFNTCGAGTTLVVLGIGGGVSQTAGTRWGIAVGIVAAVFGSLLGWAVGHVCQVAGTSSTVTSRSYGLGVRGSALASLIFAFMVLGFLALENALLYYGTLFMFGWSPTDANAIAIYGVLTVAWIVLTTFGLKLVQRTSAVLTVLAAVLVLAVTAMAVSKSDVGLGDIWAYSPERLSPGDVTAALSAIAGIAGALALTGADFGRFARTSRDVGIMSVVGSIVVNIVVVVVGTLIFQAGDAVVTDYLNDPAHAGVAATQAGATTAEKLAFMAHSNAGAYFIVLAGTLGFLVMYAAQAKAQVINTYSGSLALSNLADAVAGRGPGRFWMVVVGNVIGLLAIKADILDLINTWLGLLGILTTSLCTLMIVDFFVVRRRVPADPGRAENVNWAGAVALLVSSGVAYALTETGVTSLGFLVALVLTAVLYLALRRVLPAAASEGASG